MIGKRIKNIAKISVLAGARQAWGLGCNLYLLTYQPYLTIKTIWEQKDKSQMFLLGMTAVSPALVYGAARILWDKWKYGVVLESVGGVFGIMAVVQIGILGYLGYWVMRVWRR